MRDELNPRSSFILHPSSFKNYVSNVFKFLAQFAQRKDLAGDECACAFYLCFWADFLSYRFTFDQ